LYIFDNISKKIEEVFYNGLSGNLKDSNNLNDGLVITFCYIYDINFKPTYEEIYKNKYYNKLYERINRKDIFKSYLDYTNKYLKERID
jgi:hypothetical protein